MKPIIVCVFALTAAAVVLMIFARLIGKSVEYQTKREKELKESVSKLKSIVERHPRDVQAVDPFVTLYWYGDICVKCITRSWSLYISYWGLGMIQPCELTIVNGKVRGLEAEVGTNWDVHAIIGVLGR